MLKIEQLWQAGPVKQQSSEEAPVKQQKKRGRKAKVTGVPCQHARHVPPARVGPSVTVTPAALRPQPVVDLNSITDERERKRQRRLMKNRLTAAMSREA